MLHYGALNSSGSLDSNYNMEGNTEFLKNKGSYKMFEKENISDLKVKLKKYDIPLRIFKLNMDVAIIDYKMSNLFSVQAACETPGFLRLLQMKKMKY